MNVFKLFISTRPKLGLLYSLLAFPLMVIIDYWTIQSLSYFGTRISTADISKLNFLEEVVPIAVLIISSNLLSILNIATVQKLSSDSSVKILNKILIRFEDIKQNQRLEQSIAELQALSTSKINILNFNGFVQVYNFVLSLTYVSFFTLAFLFNNFNQNVVLLIAISGFFTLLYFFSATTLKRVSFIIKNTLNNLTVGVRDTIRLQLELHLEKMLTRFIAGVSENHIKLRRSLVLQEIISQSPRYLFMVFAALFVIIYFLIFPIKNFESLLGTIIVVGYAFQKLLPLAQQLFVSISKLKAVSALAEEYLCHIQAYVNQNEQHIKIVKDDKLNPDILLDAKNVSIKREAKTLFCDLNFTLKKNKIYLLEGDSGKGKSTLLKALCGAIQIEGTVSSSKKGNDLKFAYVQQDGYLFNGTVEKNLLNVTIEEENLSELLKILKLNEIFSSSISSTILNSKIDTEGFNISGGELQRICLLRSLSSEVDILLIDEGLSNIPKNIIEDVFTYIKKQQHMCCVFTSHDHFQKKFADMVIKI